MIFVSGHATENFWLGETQNEDKNYVWNRAIAFTFILIKPKIIWNKHTFREGVSLQGLVDNSLVILKMNTTFFSNLFSYRN